MGMFWASGASSSSSSGSSCSGSSFRPGWMRAVRNVPGSTRLIVMPSTARSPASAFTSPATPGRMPFERSRKGTCSLTELDWMATMRPHPRARMWGRAARTKRTKLSVTTSKPSRQASSSRSPNLPGAGPPELATSTSRPPNCSTVPVTTCSTPSALERSPATASTSPPVRSRISWAVASSSSRSRAQIATRAPSWARASAEAFPRPLLAPPTRATLSAKPRSMHLSASRGRPL